MNRIETLRATKFGQRIAEDEADDLALYFVETDQWRKLISGDVDVVYGPKGSGKSALYSLLRQKREDLLRWGIIPASGESVRGTPVFQELVADPPASEEQFRSLWKLYFLSLIGEAFKRLPIKNEAAIRVMDALEHAGLLVQGDWSLRRMLRAALDYVRRVESIAGKVKLNEMTGQPEGLEAKVTLREPGSEQSKMGYISADSLLEIANEALCSIWQQGY
jgi:hypothetical protein